MIIKNIFVFIFILTALIACKNESITKTEFSNNEDVTKDSRVCVIEAAAFFAQGGELFEDKGCDINTSNDGNFVYINAFDEYNNYNRTAKLKIPVSWFNEDRDKLVSLDDEFNYFMKCFEEKTEQEKSKSPLLKEKPEDDGCNWISLTVNNVPGTRVECRKAPHFSFDALVKQ